MADKTGEKNERKALPDGTTGICEVCGVGITYRHEIKGAFKAGIWRHNDNAKALAVKAHAAKPLQEVVPNAPIGRAESRHAVSSMSGDGGAAFPSSRLGTPGMSLRDYFAARAMQSILTGMLQTNSLSSIDIDRISEQAWIVTDAMLGARSKPSVGNYGIEHGRPATCVNCQGIILYNSTTKTWGHIGNDTCQSPEPDGITRE